MSRGQQGQGYATLILSHHVYNTWYTRSHLGLTYVGCTDDETTAINNTSESTWSSNTFLHNSTSTCAAFWDTKNVEWNGVKIKNNC